MGKTYLEGETLTAADLNNSLNELVNTNGYFVFTGAQGSPFLPYVDSQSGLTVTPNPLTGEHVHNAKLTANGVFVVNTHPSYFLSNSYFYSTVSISNNVQIAGDTSIGGRATIQGEAHVTGSILSSSHISDYLGDVRGVYRDAPVSSGYYIQSSDKGKFVYATGDVYLPPNIFNIGENVTIYNSTSSTIHVRQVSGVAIYLAGLGIVGDGFLDPKGLCTLLCVDVNIFVISSTSPPVSSASSGSATVDYSSIINGLGYVPYNAINPNGYITAAQGQSLFGVSPSTQPGDVGTYVNISQVGYDSGSFSTVGPQYSVGSTYSVNGRSGNWKCMSSVTSGYIYETLDVNENQTRTGNFPIYTFLMLRVS